MAGDKGDSFASQSQQPEIHVAAAAEIHSRPPAFTPIVTDGHHLQLLATGAIGTSALESLIASAQRSVSLEMYIYKGDATGDRVREALLAAGRRGVRIRILLDHFGSSELSPDYFSELKKFGAEIRYFNPSRVLRVAFRNHRKLAIADDRIAIVGGFNVGDEYAGDGVQSGWRDLGIRIAGPLVLELAVSFDRIFIASRMDQAALIVFTRGLRPKLPATDRPALLTSGPGFGGALMRYALYRDLRDGYDVNIESAYFAPTWSLRRRLARAANRGCVRLILPGKTDVGILRLAAQHLYSRILQSGAQLFEYQPQVLHAKLLVVDDVVYIGSSNLDTRSLRLNFELMVRLPIPALAAQARQLIAYDIARSRLITPREWLKSDHWWNKVERQIAFWLVTRLDPFLARRRLRTIR